MDQRSNVTELNLSGASTDDEYMIQLSNISDNSTDAEAFRVELHWRNLVFGEKKNLNSEAMENEELNGSQEEESTVSDQIPNSSVLQIDSAVNDESSNMTKANLPRNQSKPYENKKSSDNNLEEETTSEDDQQAVNKSLQHRKSVIFNTKNKSKLRETQTKEFDDSGVFLDNSNEIPQQSATESDSVINKSKFTPSKSKYSHNSSTSDEGEISVGDSSKNENTAGGSQPYNKTRSRNKLSAAKRKLLNQEAENINKKKLRKRYSSNHLWRKDDISQDDDENESEDSDREVEMKPKGKTRGDRALNQVESLSKIRENEKTVHNAKILKLLNEGSPDKLKALPRIGLKTAKMIHQYRKMNGKLKSIEDLQNMPGWSQRFFELFLSANNIILD